MTTLTPVQLAAYDRQAGFSGPDLATIVAIQLSESGGNPNAHNTNASTGDDSYGLSQINMLGALGPARLKQFGISSASQLFDPATNARAAYTLYKANGGFGPWSTFKSGAYKTHMTDAATAATTIEAANGISAIPATGTGIDAWLSKIPGLGPVSGAISETLDTAANPLGSITNAINAFSGTIFTGISDFIAIILVVALLVVGALILGRQHIGKVTEAAAKIGIAA